MLAGVRQRVSRWVGRRRRTAAGHPELLADHAEIRDIARQMARSKVELDRSLLALRSWGRDLGQRLAEARGALGRESDLRSLGETLGGLAHNFNNSLAAILAYTELMLREAHGEAMRRRLTVVRDIALEASVTVRRLQEFVSRQPQVAFGPVGLPAVVGEALEMTAPHWRDDAERRGVAIQVAQDLGAIPPVEGNPFELRDALVQLILTATGALPAGGALRIRASTEESGWVALEVRAEPAAPLSAAPGPPGALSEVEDVMERHGGSLTVEREAAGATTLRLRLHASPFQIIPASEGALAPVEPERAVRVLLVDDDTRLLEVLSDMLRSGGHEVTTAGSGEEALRLFDPRAHDVVITDLGMPRMTGWEVAERVKDAAAAVPIFLLTGWGEGVSAHEASRFVDRIIAKPVAADALLEQLAGLGRAGRESR
jgi:CheY-like chemotaxis protein